MIIQMMKQKNPENTFYIPYLQSIKRQIEQAIADGKFTDKLELESFVLPKEATIYVDISGIENIYVAGQIAWIMAEIPSGIVYLINTEIHLTVEKHIVKKATILSFPNSVNKAV
jgi:hypothetical protein